MNQIDGQVQAISVPAEDTNAIYAAKMLGYDPMMHPLALAHFGPEAHKVRADKMAEIADMGFVQAYTQELADIDKHDYTGMFMYHAAFKNKLKIIAL